MHDLLDSENSSLKILVLCTRDPAGRRAGRTAVLRTIIRSLDRLGHTVELAILAPGPLAAPQDELARLRRYHVQPPGLVRAGVNVIRYFLPRHLSLNECLFFSPSARASVRAIVRAGGYDLVVGDMVRSAPVLAGLPVPVVIDLDDRLSHRYTLITSSGRESPELLGIYGPRVPMPLRRPVTQLARRLLGREAAVLRRREVALARTTAAVSMVSAVEAASLQRDAGVPVAALPMAVVPAAQAVDVAANAPEAMIFSGGLDYHANREAIRWFAEAVLPDLRRRLPEFSLTVVGFCPPAARAELERPGLTFLGYVDDLESELRRQRAFLAPLQSGTGIKTKVLEAMALGLPVVTTHHGVTGLDVCDGVHCLIADSPATFAAHVLDLAASPETSARLGEMGRQYVSANFSEEIVTARWRALLDAIRGRALSHPSTDELLGAGGRTP